jgi:4'-phosphopantetheinyl transferase
MNRLALPEALSARAQVWRLDFDLAAAASAADRALLSEDERGRAMRFARPEDRLRYVATRAALRRLLGERLRCGPAQVRLLAGAWGKPGLAIRAAVGGWLDFNVSHAGAHALIALSDGGAVGVDIECRGPLADRHGLEQLVLSPQERRMEADQQLGFFERWVAKEAVLKAIGVGVGSDLQRLSVRAPGAEGGRRYRLDYAEPGWPRLGAWALDAPPGYAAAVACEMEIKET